MDQTKKKLALLGNGYLSGIVVEAYNMGLLEGYKTYRHPGTDKGENRGAGCKGRLQSLQHH